jgi:hypothetical protein
VALGRDLFYRMRSIDPAETGTQARDALLAALAASDKP